MLSILTYNFITYSIMLTIDLLQPCIKDREIWQVVFHFKGENGYLDRLSLIA